jgi:hypothetical protein
MNNSMKTIALSFALIGASLSSKAQNSAGNGRTEFFPVINFYVQAAAGSAFVLNKTDVGYNNTVAFLYSPQAGYQFPISKSSYLDAGIRYKATTKFSGPADNSKVNFLGLCVAYGFSL